MPREGSSHIIMASYHLRLAVTALRRGALVEDGEQARPMRLAQIRGAAERVGAVVADVEQWVAEDEGVGSAGTSATPSPSPDSAGSPTLGIAG